MPSFRINGTNAYIQVQNNVDILRKEKEIGESKFSRVFEVFLTGKTVRFIAWSFEIKTKYSITIFIAQ